MAQLNRLTDVTIKAEGKLVDVVRKIAMDIDRRLVNRTPRDTGRAARNWIVSISEPDTTQLPEPESRNAADAVIQESEQKLKNLKKGQKVFVQNNLEYIQALNNGHSPQAPPGYVDAEINAVISQYR